MHKCSDPIYQENYIWDKIWSRSYASYEKHHQVFWDIIRSKVKGKILDIACGSSSMWRGTDKEVWGVDFSYNALTESIKNNPMGHYLNDDVPTPYYDGKLFDTIIASGLVNYLPELSGIKEMIRLAGKPGTSIFITINVIEDFPERVWDEDRIHKEFDSLGDLTCSFSEGIGWMIEIVAR